MSGIYVPEEINKGEYLLVAEAPGEVETKTGRPLTGPTGQITDKMLSIMGLSRTMFDITNACPWRPPDNRLMQWVEEGDERLAKGLEELYALIEGNRYKAILAMGWYALWSLTGRDGIREHRGSVYSYVKGDIPVVGTFHPAVLFDKDKVAGMLIGPKMANIIFRDIYKFKRVITGDYKGPPKRNLYLFPSPEEVETFLNVCASKPWVSVDIEADPKTKRLTEVGVAWSATEAMCINVSDETLPFIKMFLANDVPKVFHNAPFDVPFLKYYYGMTTNGALHDTMIMHHTLYPEFPQDLGLCVSLYTDEPYYKDLRGTDDPREAARYNALDAATTAEIFGVLRKKLVEHHLYDVYDRDRRVLPIAIKMSLKGLRYDHEEAARKRARMERTWKRWQRVLDLRAGWTDRKGEKRKLGTVEFMEYVNVSSHPKVTKLLFEELELPPQYDTNKYGGKRLTTGQMKLLNLFPSVREKRARRILRAILMIRENRTLLERYLDPAKCRPGPDGRMRTTLNPARTETGRWSASMFLIDAEGTNLQTVPPEWKSCFIADEGKVLAYIDYSQIEARFVAYDAQDLAQIKVFEDGGDIHRENAARILEKPVDKVSAHERQVVGKTVHALNYDIYPLKLCETINKRGLETGVWVTLDFTREVKKRYMERFKQVPDWQNWVWNEGKAKKVLWNYLGRKRIFLGPTKGHPLSHDTRGEMIAHRPQSSVPDLLSTAMIAVDADQDLKRMGIDLLLQAHDAILVQGNADSVVEWVPIIQKHMEIPLTIHGRTCVVPADAKVGYRWSELKDWRKFCLQ